MFLDCTIINNVARDEGGGAVTTGDAIFAGTRFEANHALLVDGGFRNGAGGVLAMGGAPTFDDCHFAANFVEFPGSGGALLVCGGDPVSVNRCRFQGNEAPSQGAAAMVVAGDLQVVSSALAENVAEDGGGIAVAPGASASVDRSLLVRNEGICSGGALRNEGVLIVRRSEILKNDQPFDEGGGGALYNSGDASFEECTIADNDACFSSGGAIRNAGMLALSECTPRRQRRLRSGRGDPQRRDARGVAMRLRGERVRVRRRRRPLHRRRGRGEPRQLPVRAQRRPRRERGRRPQRRRAARDELHLRGTTGPPARAAASTRAATRRSRTGSCGATPTVAAAASSRSTTSPAGLASLDYSCLEAYAGGVNGVGNIGDDPLFVDVGEPSYRLQPSSPCIDAASNSAAGEGDARATSTGIRASSTIR